MMVDDVGRGTGAVPADPAHPGVGLADRDVGVPTPAPGAWPGPAGVCVLGLRFTGDRWARRTLRDPPHPARRQLRGRGVRLLARAIPTATARVPTRCSPRTSTTDRHADPGTLDQVLELLPARASWPEPPYSGRDRADPPDPHGDRQDLAVDSSELHPSGRRPSAASRRRRRRARPRRRCRARDPGTRNDPREENRSAHRSPHHDRSLGRRRSTRDRGRGDDLLEAGPGPGQRRRPATSGPG